MTSVPSLTLVLPVKPRLALGSTSVDRPILVRSPVPMTSPVIVSCEALSPPMLADRPQPSLRTPARGSYSRGTSRRPRLRGRHRCGSDISLLQLPLGSSRADRGQPATAHHPVRAQGRSCGSHTATSRTSFAERSAKLPGPAFKDAEARDTGMAVPVGFSRWLAGAPPRKRRQPHRTKTGNLHRATGRQRL